LFIELERYPQLIAKKTRKLYINVVGCGKIMQKEVDMDLFSRRIGPFFSWLESKIESGWTQNDGKNNLLKQSRELSTNMRGRFITGITIEELKKEIQLFEEFFNLALDKFPDYSDEIEAKLEHFYKGLKTELGEEILKKNKQEPEIKAEPITKKENVAESDFEKIKNKNFSKVNKEILRKKPSKKVVKEVVKENAKRVKDKKSIASKKQNSVVKKLKKSRKKQKSKKIRTEKKHRKKGFFIVRFFKSIIFGED